MIESFERFTNVFKNLLNLKKLKFSVNTDDFVDKYYESKGKLRGCVVLDLNLENEEDLNKVMQIINTLCTSKVLPPRKKGGRITEYRKDDTYLYVLKNSRTGFPYVMITTEPE